MSVALSVWPVPSMLGVEFELEGVEEGAVVVLGKEYQTTASAWYPVAITSRLDETDAEDEAEVEADESKSAAFTEYAPFRSTSI